MDLAVIFLVAMLLLATAGCYQPGGPVPEGKHPPAERAWSVEDVDAGVVMTLERIYSPAPTGNGAPPQECDWVHYLRFRPVEGSPNPCDADAVIVLIPGLLGGAGSLETISRQMVYVALKQRGRHIEVWAMDRRPNNLEDLTGLNAAEEARDTDVAIDYLYKGTEIGGKKFAGFLGDADVPFLSEFGLELAMRDVYTVIATNFPDPALRRQKVFVGGHSLGGPLTALFAGWDFDGDQATLDDAGFMNCAGFVANDAGPSCLKLGRGPLYSWVNFDEIGNACDPAYRDQGGKLTYTTMKEEVSDIQDVARFLHKGPSNALEWYFTTRILLDILVAAMGHGPQCGIDFLHGDMIDAVPQIDFVAGNGPLLLITDNLPDDIIVLEGYNHLDVCAAAPDRPSRRPNEVIDPLLDFVLGGK